MNPIATTRMVTNLILVVTIVSFGGAALLGYGAWPFWPWLIGGVAIAGSAGQVLASIIWPASVKSTWDEQVVSSHRASLQFGYWAALSLYFILVLLVQFDLIDDKVAFYLMAPVLAAAPSAWMVGASLLGRAG